MFVSRHPFLGGAKQAPGALWLRQLFHAVMTRPSFALGPFRDVSFVIHYVPRLVLQGWHQARFGDHAVRVARSPSYVEAVTLQRFSLQAGLPYAVQPAKPSCSGYIQRTSARNRPAGVSPFGTGWRAALESLRQNGNLEKSRIQKTNEANKLAAARSGALAP